MTFTKLGAGEGVLCFRFNGILPLLSIFLSVFKNYLEKIYTKIIDFVS